MIIGLSGLKGSGKDTVGAYLVKEHGFERRSFAGPLKQSFAAFFDMPLHEIERYKNDMKVRIEIVEYSSDEDAQKKSSFAFVNKGMTLREGLMRYGTESHRDVFGKDFWLDQALPINGYYSGRAIAITDCRFPNEAARITNLGGYIVRVERPNSGEVHHHSSEADQALIVPHYKLVNDSSIELLYNEVEKMLEHLGE